MISSFLALVLGFILLSFITFYFTTTNVYAENWTNYTVDGKFSFDYPSGWNVTGKENRFDWWDAKVVSNGTAAVLFDLNEGKPEISDDDLLQSMEVNLSRNWDNLMVFEKGTDKYIINNQTAPYIIATFDEARAFLPRNFAGMEVFVKFGDNSIVGVYSSDKNDFDKYLGTVEKIIKSIRPV